MGQYRDLSCARRMCGVASSPTARCRRVQTYPRGRLRGRPPILVRQVAGVDLMPPTVVNCRIAATLHDWIETKLQADAREVLGSPISRIITASGYACRQRIGTSNTGRSRHSFANAIDISAFIITDGAQSTFLPLGPDRTRWARPAFSGEPKITPAATRDRSATLKSMWGRPRPFFCGRSMEARAERSARCLVPKPTRLTATICTSISHRADAALFANEAKLPNRVMLR